jgi:hypothetical protein
MNIGKKAVATCALVLSLTAPAAALSIPGLPSLPTTPDICLWSYCISYTQSSLYTQIQSFYAQNAMLQSAIQNLTSLPQRATQAITGELSALMQPATASAPDVSVNAADATLANAPLTAETIKQMNDDSQVANGAHEDAQVTHEQLTQIATGIEAQRMQHAKDVQQKQTDTDTKIAGLGKLFGGGE